MGTRAGFATEFRVIDAELRFEPRSSLQLSYYIALQMTLLAAHGRLIGRF